MEEAVDLQCLPARLSASSDCLKGPTVACSLDTTRWETLLLDGLRYRGRVRGLGH